MKKTNMFSRITAIFLIAVTLLTCIPLTVPKAQAAKEYPDMDYTCEQPLFEFSTPSTIFGDYDETFTFKAKLAAYLAGSAYTTDTLWEKVYSDLIYKILNTDADAYKVDETIDEIQDIEKWLGNVIFDTVELIGQSNKAFKVASTINLAVNVMTDAAQGTLAMTLIQLKPVVYLAENASNKNIRDAAADILSLSVNRATSSFIDEAHKKMLEEGIEIGKNELKNCTVQAIKDSGTELLTYLPRVLAFVNLVLTFKDIIYFTTGQDDVLDAYINITAGTLLRLELYSYHSTLKKSNSTIELANNFNNILFLTKDIYNNFKTMMGKNYAKIIDNSSEEVDPKGIYTNDELLSKEYAELNAVTIDNYYKRVFDIMKPEYNVERLYLYPEQKTYQLQFPGIRYGVSMHFECETENDCFRIDKKTGLITLTGTEGSGTIGVLIRQNGVDYKFYIPVKVAHVQDCTYIKNAKYTSSSITLEWDKSYNAHYYTLYIRQDNAWKVLKNGLTDTSANVTGLTPGKTYSFAVRAYAMVDNKMIKSPGYPTVKTATCPTDPDNFKKKEVTESTATLTWTASKGASYYRVFRRNTTTNKWDTVVKSTTSLSAKLTNLKSNTNYLFAVRACYDKDGELFWSAGYPVASITTAGVPDAPTNLKVTAADSTSVSLSWTKGKNASGYYVYRYDTSAKKWIKFTHVTTNSIKITGLAKNTVYKFAVRSYNSVGTKAILSTTYPTTKAVTGLGKVSNFKASGNTETSVKFTWDKVANATGYRLFRYNTSTGKWDTVATTSKLTATATNLASGTVYDFAVRAYFDTGNGPLWANSYPKLKATTLPGQVKNLKGSISGTTASLTWDKVARADGYVVYSYNTSTKTYSAEKIVYTNSAKIEGLKSNKTYYYVVRAFKKCEKAFYGTRSDVVTLLTAPSEKEAAYLFNRAYTVSHIWFNFSNPYWDWDDYFYSSKGEYVRVNHPTIKTTAQVKSHLNNYFTKNLIKNNTDGTNFTHYRDYNGKLYSLNPNTGDLMSKYYLNTTTAKLKYQGTNYNYYEFKVACSPERNPNYTTYEYFYASLKAENGKWLFDSGFTSTIYGPYSWDYKSPLY